MEQKQTDGKNNQITRVVIEEIEIKIQTMDNVFQIQIQNDNTVLQLKEKITNSYKIPIESQRLIFQGKLMKDEEKISFYKITNQCVVHLVARDLEENQPNNQTNTQSNQSQQQQQGQSGQRVESVFENRIPLLFVPMRTNQRRRRVILPHYDISECFEALYQNMITIDNLTQCKSTFTTKGQHAKTEVFDLKKTQYEVGQWVDAKDTIDQWLEAQVIQVKDNKAFIHYNGWGTRWDEWIDFDSPRMRHFKFYTLQPPSSSFMSPYPGVPCDSNIEPQSRSIDSFFYLEKTKEYISDLLKVMERLCELRKKDKTMIEDNYLNKEDQELLFLTTQMIPFMDRVGRMLSDMSLQFSHLVINPNLYPQMLMGYKRNQMFNKEDILKIELKPKIDNDELIIKDNDNKITKSEQKPIEMITHNSSNTTTPINQMSQLITQTPLTHPLQEVNTEVNSNRQNQSSSTSSLVMQHETLTRRFTEGHNNITNNTDSNTEQNQLPIQTNLGYDLTVSSNDLPFIQRVFSSFTRSDRIISPSSHISQLNQHEKSFPKVNLQLPALLSNGEVMAMTGSYPFSEPNFDIYVHTVQTQASNTTRIESNLTNTTNTIPNTNTTNENNDNRNNTEVNNQILPLSTLTEPNANSNTNRVITNQIPQTTQQESLTQNQTTHTQTQVESTQLENNGNNSNPLQPHRFFKDKSTQTNPEDFD